MQELLLCFLREKKSFQKQEPCFGIMHGTIFYASIGLGKIILIICFIINF